MPAKYKRPEDFQVSHSERMILLKAYRQYKQRHEADQEKLAAFARGLRYFIDGNPAAREHAKELLNDRHP